MRLGAVADAAPVVCGHLSGGWLFPQVELF
jgi:hypothetical protein